MKKPQYTKYSVFSITFSEPKSFAQILKKEFLEVAFGYDASGSPMYLQFNNSRYFYATNVQGDVTALVHISGTAVVEYTYDAWGNILTTTGSMASTLGQINPLRYRGYVYDPETELYYCQSRYYDPKIGRFLNADALVSTGQGIFGNNMFAYCNNNAVMFADPSGFALFPCTTYINDDGNSSKDERDVTDEIFSALIDAVNHAREVVAIANLIGRDSVVSESIIYLYFYSEVDHWAPWDIKREEPWELTIGTKYPGYDVYVNFAGMKMTPEYLGNFTYGFLGYAYTIPLDHLFGGSYYAANFPTSGNPLYNEALDWIYISLGYQYAEEVYSRGK